MPAPPSRRAQKMRQVDGIVLLDKPLGMSSNQALQKARRLFRAAKGGHTGSLDPLATGLLPICLGEATKIAGLLLDGRKGYDAEVVLGMTRRGDDAEGEILEIRAVPELDDEAIAAALDRFRGSIEQVPPVYSALKKDGVPLYKLARRGIEVAPEPRTVTIDRLDLLAREGDRLSLRVECTAGTYIRSLARDLGATLGCGAHLAGLRRTFAAPFDAPLMHSLAELEALHEREGEAGLDRFLLPIEAGIAHLPTIELDPADAALVRDGRPLRRRAEGLLALRAEGRLLALADGGEDGWIRVRRGFNP